MFMNVDIISDTICPWCFVGKRRFERALRERPDVQAEVRWRTFQLNPEMPAEGMDRSDYVNQKFGGEERAHAHVRALREKERGWGPKFLSRCTYCADSQWQITSSKRWPKLR